MKKRKTKQKYFQYKLFNHRTLRLNNQQVIIQRINRKLEFNSKLNLQFMGIKGIKEI